MFSHENIGFTQDICAADIVASEFTLCSDQQWVTRTRTALQENRLCLFFQRIAPLHVREVCERFEVLVRMQDSDGRLVAPGAFIAAAESHGLMPQLDRRVISNSFALLAQQPERDYRCSINLSGASLSDEGMLAFIQRQFREHPVDPRRICFEITESVVSTQFATAFQLFDELKSLGCHFALDDFGSSLRSFGYLRSLPVDYLKIDAHFIRQLVDNSTDYAMADTINRISHLMNIKTVAEFVERAETCAALRRIGVDYAQGYWIHPPQCWHTAVEQRRELLPEASLFTEAQQAQRRGIMRSRFLSAPQFVE